MTFRSFSTVIWDDGNGGTATEPSATAKGFPTRLSHYAAVRVAKSFKRSWHGFKPMCIVNVWPKGEPNPFKDSRRENVERSA